tara:strand:- start:188 stop:1255 length:1068 start_codon:yes stop_codon:yes gene_type:complete
MAYTTIDNPGLFFKTVIYAGNSTDNTAITGVGFQPDLVWLRNRNNVENHLWQDSVRGASGGEFYYIQSNTTAGDQTQGDGDGVVSLDSDGFTLGYNNSTGWNQTSSNYVAWNWLGANGTASNGNGSITSTVSVNTTAGFSIVSYTGTGSNATVGHGLGAVPKMIITKGRSFTDDWLTYHESIGNGKYVILNKTDAAASSSLPWNSTTPTSSVFSIGSSGTTNNNGGTIIAYCFAEVKGYSKFGSYEGNGNDDGTFVYTGFKPAFVITKRADTGGDNWHILDNKRDIDNPAKEVISVNSSSAEGTTSTSFIDFLSNGFKCRGTGASINTSGLTYIYMAFAETPFVTSGTKAAGTAR